MHRKPIPKGKKQSFQYFPNNEQNNLTDNESYETNNKTTENNNRSELPTSKKLLPVNNNKIFF